MQKKPTSFESLKTNGGYKSSAGKTKRHRFDLSGAGPSAMPLGNPLKTGALPEGGPQGFNADDGVVSVPDSETMGEDSKDENDTLPMGGSTVHAHAPNATIHIHNHPARMAAFKKMQSGRHSGY